MDRYWADQDVADSKRVRTFLDLSFFGLRILRRMPQPVIQVCGPITTGGTGSVQGNTQILAKAIKELRGRGLSVFNQLAFDEALVRIAKTYKDEYDLLEGFYLPLFESGYIKQLHFLPTWRTSVGARWEYRKGVYLGLEIHLL